MAVFHDCYFLCNVITILCFLEGESLLEELQQNKNSKSTPPSENANTTPKPSTRMSDEIPTTTNAPAMETSMASSKAPTPTQTTESNEMTTNNMASMPGESKRTNELSKDNEQLRRNVEKLELELLKAIERKRLSKRSQRSRPKRGSRY